MQGYGAKRIRYWLRWISKRGLWMARTKSGGRTKRAQAPLSDRRYEALEKYAAAQGSTVATEASMLLSPIIDKMIENGEIPGMKPLSSEDTLITDIDTQAELEAKSRVLRAIATGDKSELEPGDLENVSKSIDVTTDEIKKKIEVK